MGDDNDEVRAAIVALRAGTGDLSDVITLANSEREPPLLPQAVTDAIQAKFELDPDVANGGLDQFAWNHGEEITRLVAKILREVGAIENADVLDRLATGVAKTRAELGDDAIASDPVKHFLAYRHAVGGPEFGIPDHSEEIAEALVEYVIARASSLPDPESI